jgi:hypothetical protein
LRFNRHADALPARIGLINWSRQRFGPDFHRIDFRVDNLG